MNEPKIVVPPDFGGMRRNGVLEHSARLTTTQPGLEVRIMATKDCIRCALCGREGQSLVAFALLAEACKKASVPLKAPRSIAFDPGCARRAFRAIEKADWGVRS